MADGEENQVPLHGRFNLEQALLRRTPPPTLVSWEREMVRGYFHTFGEYSLPITNASGEEEIVVIHEDTKMIATRVWDCATMTLKWLEYISKSQVEIPDIKIALNLKIDPSSEQRPVQVLELGAGTGLLSVCLAKMGAAVLATEYGPVVKHLEFNCQCNGVLLLPDAMIDQTLVAGKAKCRELDWYKTTETLESMFSCNDDKAVFDLVIVTDCSLTERDTQGVFDMIQKYSTKDHTKVVMGLCLEREGTPLSIQKAKQFTNFRQVETSQQHPNYTTTRHTILLFDA